MRTVFLVISLLPLAACKPPPTDAGLNGEVPEAAPSYASDPLPSPDVEGALWTASKEDQATIIYGVPGRSAIMTLACLGDDDLPRIRITRNSPADKGAGALLALVGNGHIGRVKVDAVKVGGGFVWQGDVLAANNGLEPLTGPRQSTATIPGAGMVTLNASPLPMQWLKQCRES